MANSLRYLTTSAQGILEESSTPYHKLGDVLELGDRRFRYCKAAEALTAGQVASHYDGNAMECAATSSEIQTTAVGSKTIRLIHNNPAITAGEFNDGYIAITNSTGEGYMYKIKEHGATAAPTSSVTLTLYDEVQVATVAASTAGKLLDSPYVVQKINTTSTAFELPICVNLVAITSGYYFWGQTRGPACLQSAGNNIVEGAPVAPALNSDGKVHSKVSSTKCQLYSPIGKGMLASLTTGSWGIVWLTLE